MIRFRYENCIFCGKCAWDCFPGAIGIADHTPYLEHEEKCIACGHCIAVCPKNAVYDDKLDMNECVPVGFSGDPENLLHSMQARRSCRHFKSQPVSREHLNMLLEAARACPTAKNLQGTRYISVTKSLDTLLDTAIKTLGTIGNSLMKSAADSQECRRAKNFIRWAEMRESDPSFDPLFFHAPMVLLFVSQDDPRDAAAAASYAELMAAHVGLGCLYSGYFTACCDNSPEIRDFLCLSPAERVVRCLVLGYPDVHFFRTAPRKAISLTEL